MRRILLIALASSSVAVAVPVAASAHDHASGNARHERLHHHRRHHARFVHFASRSSVTSMTTSGTSTPPASPGEAVGTIASFEGGVLKLTLNDGTTVSGTVTDGTEIKCAGPAATTSDRNGGPGSSGREDGQGEDGQDQGDDHGEGDEEGHGPGTQECATTSLLAGAKVQEAELKLSDGHASWESVELAG